MNAVLEQIQKIGIVPVVVINNEADAVPLAKALCAGGLPCAEVTFRTAAAAGAIKAMTDAFPNMCVGAPYGNKGIELVSDGAFVCGN